MSQRDWVLRIVEFMLVIPFLVGCTVSQTTSTPTHADTVGSVDEPTPVSTPTLMLTSMPPNSAPTTATPTIDPCTGWWCTVTGIVYTDVAEQGNELEGASVTLHQTSYCSPTRGQHQTTSNSDGRFEFGEVFFHDTDRIRIQVTYEGYEPALWDSRGLYCLYCGCFGLPVQAVLRAAPSQ
jgi:hypothetical protein